MLGILLFLKLLLWTENSFFDNSLFGNGRKYWCKVLRIGECFEWGFYTFLGRSQIVVF